jgi:aspartyl-tRNA(Asn)/glutamyl-tRNA(Gln) amidotransferase subunit A
MPTQNQNLYSLSLKEAIVHADAHGADDLCKALIARIEEVNPKVNAFLRFDGEKSLISSNQKGLLKGVPIALKDNICVDGLEVTCSSKILQGHVPPYDAHVVTKLKAAGASLLGQCNMDEFAFGSSCETSAFSPTRNPWNLDYVPGGSSGGSAAAVAADMALAALGSDTGGSIRQPAAFCGVVGLKPTYGRVSRYGLIAFGSSFDQIGPITKTVEDSAILMNVLAGQDKRDSTSTSEEVPDYTKFLTGDVKGLKIGLPEEYFAEGLDSEVNESVCAAAKTLESMGAVLKNISLPHTQYAVAVYYIVAVAEASSNLGRFDGVRYGKRAEADTLKEMYVATRDQGFGDEVKRRILLGTFVLSAGYYDAYYRQGQKVRSLIQQDFNKAFSDVDVILTPTSPTPAFKVGEKLQDPLAMYLSDILTIPANLAGIPAISVPCGFSKAGLPIGLQLMAKPFAEGTLLQVADAFEKRAQVNKKKPNL